MPWFSFPHPRIVAALGVLALAACFHPESPSFAGASGNDGDDGLSDATHDSAPTEGAGADTTTEASAETATIFDPDGGHVAFVLDGALYVMAAEPGGSMRELGPELDALAPGVDESFIRISSDGRWLLLSSERFDPACVGYACLTIAPIDLGSTEVLRGSDAAPLHQADGAAIADGGDAIVFSASGGVHTSDLFYMARTGDGWSAPVSISDASPSAYNTMPQFDGDAARVAFDCGDEPYAAEGTAICEVAIDGTGLRVVWSPAQPPSGTTAGGALHHPSYTPAGALVFEGAWTGEQLWVLAPDAREPVRVRPDHNNDNTPCVLPDGRIASLWLGRPDGNGVHELELKSADGATAELILEDRDILDGGLSCGR